MDLLVIGGGGREHAIVAALRRNETVGTIYALPGNGGIARLATCVPIAADDIDGIVGFARDHAVDFAVVVPDNPLVLGLVDRLEDMGLRCFGPRGNAAILEGSKHFAKDFMKRHGIPTASYEVFSDISKALDYAKTCPIPAVVKADGLALGKGVVIAESRRELEDTLRAMMVDGIFGKSGKTVLIEEFLTGPEVSVLSFTDGKTIVPMVSSMDHKKAYDGDRGPNTGGMGTIAPNPFYTPEIADICMKRIFLPTVCGMRDEGRPFLGCLYFGLMVTADGPKVIEYNCRFGDPEAQVVLPLLKSDLLSVMLAVSSGTLDRQPVEFSDRSACCVVLASGGYPKAYEKGKPIFLSADPGEGVSVFHAGTRLENGILVTSGGRVLNITATAPTLREAVRRAYAALPSVRFDKMTYRSDIGKRALDALGER